MQTQLSIQEFIERTRPGSFHYGLVALCAGAVFMDGMDAQTLGYAAPALVKSLGIKPAALGSAFSAGLIGITAGSLLFGLLGDMLGRKRTILLCVALLGVCTVMTATAPSVDLLFFWRLLAGLGIGGVGPNAYALASEYSAARLRPIFIMIVATCFPLGAALGGILAAWLIGAFGWQSVFIVSGAITLGLLPLMLVWLPDSIVQKVMRGDQRGAVAIARRMDGGFGEVAPQFRSSFEGSTSIPLGMLFRDRRVAMTLLLWTIYFCTMLDNYFLTTWLPTLMHAAGRSVQTSVLLTSLLQFGGTAGGVVVSFALRRFDQSKTLFFVYAVAAVAIVGIGVAGSSNLLLGSAAFMAGFMLNGGQIGAVSLASGYYPPVMRSTGLGWAGGIGKLGAVIGAWIGGVLLAAQLGYVPMFAIIALPALVAAISSLTVDRAGDRKRPAPDAAGEQTAGIA